MNVNNTNQTSNKVLKFALTFLHISSEINRNSRETRNSSLVRLCFNSNNTKNSCCSAVAIGEQKLITAAHCLKRRKDGTAYKIEKNKRITRRRVTCTKNVKSDPYKEGTNKELDFAICTTNIPFNIIPVPFCKNNDQVSMFQICGFGPTGTHCEKETEPKIFPYCSVPEPISNKIEYTYKCKDHLEQPITKLYPPRKYPGCYKIMGKGSCNGDSGGAFFGINSNGKQCYLGVITRSRKENNPYTLVIALKKTMFNNELTSHHGNSKTRYIQTSNHSLAETTKKIQNSFDTYLVLGILLKVTGPIIILMLMLKKLIHKCK